MAKTQVLKTVTNKNVRRASQPDLKEEVAKRAYEYYVERGCQHGHDQEDWLKAETAVQNQKGL